MGKYKNKKHNSNISEGAEIMNRQKTGYSR